jgi:hypothetical protein
MHLARSIDSHRNVRSVQRAAAELRQVDDARARWYAHSAVTRVTADRAQLEPGQRGAGQDADENTTTTTTSANRWLDHTDDSTPSSGPFSGGPIVTPQGARLSR